jgi:hypothetical protein
MNEKWINIKSTINNLGEDNELTIHVEREISLLKSNIISLMAYKLGWDTNIKIYKNNKSNAKSNIDNLICWDSGCNMYELREIKNFIEENL